MCAQEYERKINYRWPYSKNREDLKQNAIIAFTI